MFACFSVNFGAPLYRVGFQVPNAVGTDPLAEHFFCDRRHPSRRSGIRRVKATRGVVERCALLGLDLIMTVLLFVYVPSRLALIAQTFSFLRRQPANALSAVDWTKCLMCFLRDLVIPILKTNILH